MKPWREIAIPHQDVLEGTFQQAEFAADITAVRSGKAMREYQDAVAFFQRTFITEGMRLLLIQVARRLNGKGGEPVIQLQTAFGGGKTHTMLAVYHLASRSCSLTDLAGIPQIIEQAGLKDIKHAKIAVLDGNAHSPGQPWKHGKQSIKTLWGELAWQLGGEEGYAMLKQADTTGTSPGKDILVELISKYAPCVILIDELLAYIRQFNDAMQLSGGSFDSNMSFIQALTESCKIVPNAITLASLPESEVEAGSDHGRSALLALEKIFGRVQAIWKPVATEESFEIVRRRLFEPVKNEVTRETVCRKFIETYVAEGARLPGETQESEYFDRLMRAYPIHPEVFDRLYEDWSTLENFQRTRGVLKLMAKIIYRLWKNDNRDMMIMPGSLPLYDNESRNELLNHLGPGWDPVIEKDVDGDRSETAALEMKEARFGTLNAARRVARTVFLGSAPASVSTRPGIRGIDKARILLGCLEPGQMSAIYTDALHRLADRLHYMSSSAEKNSDNVRFWFDTRANLRREMEDRKNRFTNRNEITGKMAEVMKRLVTNSGCFDGVHIFTPNSDVPDDRDLRLVVLNPDIRYYRENPHDAEATVFDMIKNNGSKPRHRSNRMLFLATDSGAYSRFEDCIKTELAWNSIVADVRENRLNIDQLQKKQAETELANIDKALPAIARECYRWLLCPAQYAATEKPVIEAFQLNTGTPSLNNEIERVCRENELIIDTWAAVHLHARLTELYWKGETVDVQAMKFWEDSLRYLYLPRLKNKYVLEKAINAGAASQDYFGIAYGKKDNRYEGFAFGKAIAQLDDTLLLISPPAAKKYAEQLEAEKKATSPAQQGTGPDYTAVPQPPATGKVSLSGGQPDISGGGAAKNQSQSFIGTVEVNPAKAKLSLAEVADEVISLLTQIPDAEIKITLEINANFPGGISEDKKRPISENANSLNFKNKTWE